jgi:hypothetical protein
MKKLPVTDQRLLQFDRTRDQLEHLLWSGDDHLLSGEYHVVSQEAEDLLQAAWDKHAGEFFQRTTDAGRPTPDHYYPALKAETTRGTLLCRPYKTARGRGAGFVVEFTRHKIGAHPPAAMALAADTDMAFASIVIFPTVSSAMQAAYVHSKDGTAEKIKLNDGLFWSIGQPLLKPHPGAAELIDLDQAQEAA